MQILQCILGTCGLFPLLFSVRENLAPQYSSKGSKNIALFVVQAAVLALTHGELCQTILLPDVCRAINLVDLGWLVVNTDQTKNAEDSSGACSMAVSVCGG